MKFKVEDGHIYFHTTKGTLAIETFECGGITIDGYNEAKVNSVMQKIKKHGMTKAKYDRENGGNFPRWRFTDLQGKEWAADSIPDDEPKSSQQEAKELTDLLNSQWEKSQRRYGATT